jgi:hypothetical protein
VGGAKKNTEEETGGWGNTSMWSSTICTPCQTLSGIRHETGKIRWMWHVTCMKEKRGAYRILVGGPEEKRPLGKPDRRREKNIETNFQEMGWGRGMD